MDGVNAAALVDNLRKRGFTISACDGRLEIEGPPGTITPALRQQLKEQKQVLLANLDPPPPLPEVTCSDCRHFIRDKINPPQGIGRCGVGQDGLLYPNIKRRCPGFQISRSALDEIAIEVASEIDGFADIVLNETDYDQPHQIRRLAVHMIDLQRREGKGVWTAESK
ncbi:MAG: hypothetical protein RQ826_09520 [Xanthomonadales bacterium]|nr:hypothetical protein [Xanthomonadales bacterium]